MRSHSPGLWTVWVGWEGGINKTYLKNIPTLARFSPGLAQTAKMVKTDSDRPYTRSIAWYGIKSFGPAPIPSTGSLPLSPGLLPA